MAKTDKITLTTSAATALTKVMRRGADDLAQHLAAVKHSDDPEGPHKARVTLRRLRVALSALKPIVRSTDLQTRMRDLFRSLGTLRDADVLAQTLDTPELHAAATASRAQVRATLPKRPAKTLAHDIAKTFAGKDWHRKGTKSLRRAPVAPLAHAALTRAWAASLTFGPDLTLLPEEPRHEFRKSLKTLRYLCDQFAGLWPGPVHDAHLTRLKALQDDLGTLNDQATARSFGFDAPDNPATLRAAQSHWAALQTLPVWWHNGKSP